MEVPDSATTDYRIYIYCYNELHQAEDLDSNPSVTAENQSGTDRSANLGVVTKPGGTTGQYYVDYTVTAGDTSEQIFFKVDAVEDSSTTQYCGVSQVIDQIGQTFSSQVADIHAKLPSKDYLRGTDESDGSMDSDDTDDINAQVDVALNTAIPGAPTADSVNERLAAIDDKLPSSSYLKGSADSDGGMDAADKADVNAEVDTALDTAIPGSPTADSVNERVAAIDDAITVTVRASYTETNDTITVSAWATRNGVVMDATDATLTITEVDGTSKLAAGSGQEHATYKHWRWVSTGNTWVTEGTIYMAVVVFTIGGNTYTALEGIQS
jgi:hypothetical protein